MKTLGERIRELREEQDISVRELAKKLGVTAPFWSDVELGRRYPREEILLKAAKELKVKVEDLKQHDTRPTGQELKRIATSNPALGMALRQVVDKGISPEELLKFLNNRKTKQ